MQHCRKLAVRGALPFLLLLAGCGLLTGCGGGGSSSQTTTMPPVTTPPAQTPAVSAAAADGLTATLSENAATVAPGGTLTYTFTLKNGTSAPVPLMTSLSGTTNEPIAALTLTNAAGVTVYPTQHPLTGPPTPPGTGQVTLLPGQAVSKSLSLAAFGATGAYQAVASFTVAASSVAAAQTVTLPPLTVTAQ